MEYIQKKIDEDIEEIIRVLQNFIKIDTQQKEAQVGAPFGLGNKKALEYLIYLAEKYNLKYKNIDNYVCWIEIGEGKKMLGFPVHLDIVPPGEEWSVNPFSGVLEEGYIYGRGAVDNKGPAVIMLFLLKFLKENKGILLKKRIRVIFGFNEETGMECIKYYKEKGEEEPEMGFTPDALYPVVIGEKGMLHIVIEKAITVEKNKPFIEIIGGEKSNIVPGKAECILYNFDFEGIKKLFNLNNERVSVERKNNKICLKYNGQSCHASNPEKGVNSITHILKVIKNNIFTEYQIKKEIEKFNEVIGTGYYGESIGLGIEDEIFGRLTLNLGILKIEKSTVYSEIDIRYPSNITSYEIVERLKEKFGKDYKIKIKNNKPIHYVDKESEIVKKLMEIFTEETGRKEEYLVIGGGTYASYFKNIVGFGPKFKEIRTGGHGKDERISIEAIKENLKIYYKAIIALNDLD